MRKFLIEFLERKKTYTLPKSSPQKDHPDEGQ